MRNRSTAFISASIFGFCLLLVGISASTFAAGGKRRTEARYCPTCAAAHSSRQRLQRLPVLRTCPELTSTIAKHVPAGQISCYESLFGYESSCSTTVAHDQVKTGNPYAGVGLCALEKDDNVRMVKQNRGPDCARIATLDEQVKCCISIMRRTGGRYFGTVVISKVTPRCY